MIKLTYCVRRRADVDPKAFRRYWLENHGPLVAKHAEALRAVRYVQSHTTDEATNDLLRASRGSAEPYDGITEVWWESPEDLAAGLTTPEGEAASLALLEDERNFVDLEHSSLFMTDEHEIFDRRD